MLVALLTASSLLLAGFVKAQDPTPIAVPGSVCPQVLIDQINVCRSQVYADESALPQGPCFSSDWACICNVQQGLLACYAPCPGNTPQTDIDYNNGQCNGQNGVINAAAQPGGPEYQGSALTTTIPAGVESPTTGVASSTVVSSDALTSSVEPTSDPLASTSVASTSITDAMARPTTSSTSSSSSSSSSASRNGPQANAPQSTGSNVFDGSASTLNVGKMVGGVLAAIAGLVVL